MGHLIIGHALEVLKRLPGESVQVCVTSPPYWGLRNYGDVTCTVWDGDEECDHVWGDKIPRAGYKKSDTNPGKLQSVATQNRDMGTSQFCQKCGAWYGQLGLEPTPELYVEHLNQIFREVKRILRKDGTFWLNIGDSFNGSSGSGGKSKKQTSNAGSFHGGHMKKASGLKMGELCGIPWRVAFALQSDGWYLRMDNIWKKTNPMPESVIDRPTRSHEYLFLFTKSGRTTFWIHPRKSGVRKRPKADYIYIHRINGETFDFPPPVKNKKLFRKLWKRRNLWEGRKYYYDADAIREPLADSTKVRDLYTREVKEGHKSRVRNLYSVDHTRDSRSNPLGRNKRSVWEISTKSYSGAHYAVFPENLITPCILAGSSHKACEKCGAPWSRVIQKGDPLEEWKRVCGADSKGGYEGRARKDYKIAGAEDASAVKSRILAGMVERKTIGWRPTCSCNALGLGKSVVLDPFIGSGTTAEVAEGLGREWLGIDLDPKSDELTRERFKCVNL